MKRKLREVEGMSLSFLDVISCGFGALILLLVLTKVYDPVVFDPSITDLDGYLKELEETLATLKGETRVLNRNLLRREDLKTDQVAQLTRIQSELATLERTTRQTQLEGEAQAAIQAKLADAKQSLTEEMQALLKGYQKSIDETVIGGIPVDSEYVIFIIDTSGSMFSYAWPMVVQKLAETLEVYPNLKGIQVMNDMGQYMFAQYAGQWIPDTPARRQAIINRLRDWNVFSNSSPVEGVTKAIQRFYAADKRISLYVFGDDFSGGLMQNVVNTVRQKNASGSKGSRVRIHTVGFPVLMAQPGAGKNAARFAALMRKLAEDNNGSFVGLNSLR